jgi:hypothetical protein
MTTAAENAARPPDGDWLGTPTRTRLWRGC